MTLPVKTRNRAQTDRHLDVLAFIQEYFSTEGYPPTVREIGQALGMRSTSTVDYHLKSLAAKGLIVVSGSLRNRAIRLTFGGGKPGCCPNCGYKLTFDDAMAVIDATTAEMPAPAGTAEGAS
jgi:repressor LexA